MYSSYTVKVSVLFYCLIVMRLGSSLSAGIAFLLTPIYALLGPRHAIEALFLSFIFVNINDVLFPGSSISSLSRYIIVAAAFGSVFIRDFVSKSRAVNTYPVTIAQQNVDALFVSFVAFFGYGLIHSFLVSSFPIISILKIVIWAMSVMTLVRAWQIIDSYDRKIVEQRIYFLLSLSAVCTLLLMPLDASYLPRTNLLRGMLNHSQALGAVSGILAVWSLMRALSSPRPEWRELAIFCMAIFCILSSGARTALISVVVTILIVGMLSYLRIGSLSMSKLPGTSSRRFIIVALSGLSIAILKFGSLQDVLVKGYDTPGSYLNLTELYMSSRGGLLDAMMQNIRDDSVTRIGFGIASNPHSMDVTYVMGIPIGAAIEKGLTLIQVWEELGLIGACLFLITILAMVARCLHLPAERLAVFVVILFLNMGEASLFSAGGVGLIQLIFVGWVLSDVDRFPSIENHQSYLNMSRSRNHV